MMTKISRLLTTALVAGTMSLAAPGAHAAWTLNMTPGISDMSRKIYALHMLMFWWCVAIAIVVFGCDDLLDGAVPQVQGRGRRPDADCTAPGRDHLDRGAGADPDQHGGAGRADAGQDRGPRRNTELTIRVTGYQWKWGYDYVDTGVDRSVSTLARDSNRARQLDSGIDPFTGAELPARRRSSAGGAGRRQGAAADHRRGRDPLLVGAGARRSRRTRSRASSTRPGSRSMPTRPAPIRGHAPSCAAATTASCRSCVEVRSKEDFDAVAQDAAGGAQAAGRDRPASRPPPTASRRRAARRPGAG